jgi:hypothetical protein
MHRIASEAAQTTLLWTARTDSTFMALTCYWTPCLCPQCNVTIVTMPTLWHKLSVQRSCCRHLALFLCHWDTHSLHSVTILPQITQLFGRISVKFITNNTPVNWVCPNLIHILCLQQEMKRTPSVTRTRLEQRDKNYNVKSRSEISDETNPAQPWCYVSKC